MSAVVASSSSSSASLGPPHSNGSHSTPLRTAAINIHDDQSSSPSSSSSSKSLPPALSAAEKVAIANRLAASVHQQTIATVPELVLDSGVVLKQVSVAYKSWGKLNAAADNAMVVCHALTGSADLESWWSELLGVGKPFDPSHYFVICANVLASPYGTVSPLSVHPGSGELYGADFPLVTVKDTVRLHRLLLDSLGVKQVAVVLGGSLGGMQVLEWASLFGPEYVRAIIPIATSGRYSAWGISFNEVQRQAIFTDPAWNDGRYALNWQPVQGLATARMAAMLTYRSPHVFAARFGRQTQYKEDEGDSEYKNIELAAGNGNVSQSKAAVTHAHFAAQSYLQYQGDKFWKRFDANCYVRITETLDSHQLGPVHGTEEQYLAALRGISQPALIIGIDSDVLFTAAEHEELATNLPNNQQHIIHSLAGHDGFLLEAEQIGALILPWLAALRAGQNPNKKEIKSKENAAVDEVGLAGPLAGVVAEENARS